MYPNYSTNLKLVIIALSLISSISFSLSLNMAPSLLNINKFAFAQQNPVLPNYRGDHRSFEPSKTLDNQANLASNEIQSKSLVHYQPITPASNSYTGNSNEASMNGVPISIPNMINSTNPSSLVQPVSLTHYQPITPAGSGDPIGIRIIAFLVDKNHPWPAVTISMEAQVMVVITAATIIATMEEAIRVVHTSLHPITIIVIMQGERVIIVVTIPVVITMEHLHQQVAVEHLHQQVAVEHLHQQVAVEHLHQRDNYIWHIYNNSLQYAKVPR